MPCVQMIGAPCVRAGPLRGRMSRLQMGEASGLRFLVFGGAGFLGPHLIRTLLEDYPDCQIVALDRAPRPHPPCCFPGDRRVAFLYGVDVLRPETYREELCRGADCLFNLIGLISFWAKDKDRLYQVNVTGTERLFAAARQARIRRAVHVSSVAAIGYCRQGVADETLPVDWPRFRRKHYMFTKHLGELAALRCSAEGLPVVVVNPCVMYGPGEIQDLLRLFRNLAAGRVPAFPPGGTAVVDVRDVARGVVAAYRQGTAGQRYILAGPNTPFADLFPLISRELGVPPPRRCLPRFLAAARPLVRGLELLSGEKPVLTADEYSFGFIHRYHSARKAMRELGWEPRFGLRQSIQDAAAWYREQGLLPLTGRAARGQGT